MKIGYPCINRSIRCKSNKTFRLKSYTNKRLIETIRNNLDCLSKILEFNIKNGIFFFRITSKIVPYASHPICKLNWQKNFRKEFKKIGSYIKEHNIRISMHPGQYILINPIDNKVFERSLNELIYHNEILNLMELDSSAKIQIHVGGIYGEKEKSIDRFVKRFESLEESLRDRIVIENDEKSYCLKDCIRIHNHTEVPVLFDSFHHTFNNSGETITEAFELFTKTWKKRDGIPMVDYSSQQNSYAFGKHVETIDLEHFKAFIKKTLQFDYDLMLEIKDKEQSALKAINWLKQKELDKHSQVMED